MKALIAIPIAVLLLTGCVSMEPAYDLGNWQYSAATDGGHRVEVADTNTQSAVILECHGTTEQRDIMLYSHAGNLHSQSVEAQFDGSQAYEISLTTADNEINVALMGFIDFEKRREFLNKLVESDTLRIRFERNGKHVYGEYSLDGALAVIAKLITECGL